MCTIESSERGKNEQKAFLRNNEAGAVISTVADEKCLLHISREKRTRAKQHMTASP